MPTHSETKILKYKPEQMFDLVADVNSYPKFLPWCSAARIHSRNTIGKNEILEADLVISFKVFREKFASKLPLSVLKTKYLQNILTDLLSACTQLGILKVSSSVAKFRFM